MFVTEVIYENGFEKILLKDILAGTSAAIIPSCGAILNAFVVQHNGALRNVIDSYDSYEDFVMNVTNKGFKGCKLSPFACRIKEAKYSFGEKAYTVQKFWLGKNAIHGLIYDAPFTILENKGGQDEAIVSLKFAYEATDPGYPFYYDCIITYKLTAGNHLTVTTEVINKDKGLIPIHDGWHPYFTFGGNINNLQLEFQSTEKLIFDDELIPTGESISFHDFDAIKTIGDLFLDNSFLLNFHECQPLCVLRDPEQKIQLEVYPDKSYPYLQIYTPPHRNSIAIENLSAAPDAFNNKLGLVVLQPSENITFATTYKITSLNI